MSNLLIGRVSFVTIKTKGISRLRVRKKRLLEGNEPSLKRLPAKTHIARCGTTSSVELSQSSAQHVHIIKCSDDYHPETNQPHPLPGLERDVVPAVAQQGNQMGAKKTLATGGLVKILKECRAARDVMITAGALVVCFLPVWIFNIYYMFKDEAPSSVEMLSINSLYCTTTICNPIIYSVRMKQVRQAVRKMFKLQHG